VNQRLPGNLDIETAARRQKAWLGQRQRHFFRDGDIGTAVEHMEEPPADSKQPDERLYLSIAEMFVRQDAAEWKANDFVVVLSAKTAAQPPDQPTTLTFFAGPDTIRLSATTLPSGHVVTDLPIASIDARSTDSMELSLMALRVARNRRTQRILETVDSMIPGIDYAANLLGSMSWADAILDRLEVLIHSPDTRRIFIASCRPPAARSVSTTRYSVFLGPDLRPDVMGSPLLRSVRDGRLWSGIDHLAASPCRHQEFALVRLGRRIEKNAPVSIHQLRRDRASGGSAYRLDKGPVVDYLAEQAHLRKVRRLNNLYGAAGMQRLPLVTPIALEVANDLVPLVESATKTISREFQELLSLMKEALRYELGFEMPGVRIRGNVNDLPHGSYSISINEHPLVTGSVRHGWALTNDTVEGLRKLGIEAETAINPANGSECAWVKEADFARVTENKLHLWRVLDYMVLHLSAVLRKNAVEFLGLRVVADLVRARRGEAYSKICAVRAGLPSFVNVLSMLADEGVPLIALERICTRYLELASTNRPLWEIAEEIRCIDGVREKLRSDKSHVHVWRLSPGAAALIEGGIIRSGESALLALEPQPTQDILTAVRNAVQQLPPTDSNPFILVDDWQHRRPVRKLVELEFPHLRVIATRELTDLPDDAIREIGVIDYGSADGADA